MALHMELFPPQHPSWVEVSGPQEDFVLLHQTTQALQYEAVACEAVGKACSYASAEVETTAQAIEQLLASPKDQETTARLTVGDAHMVADGLRLTIARLNQLGHITGVRSTQTEQRLSHAKTLLPGFLPLDTILDAMLMSPRINDAREGGGTA
jgi:hypothetical protein